MAPEHAPAAWERLDRDVLAALPTLVELLDRPVADDAWLPFAACRDMPAAEAGFYPEGRGAALDAARRTCDVCPVRWECLAAALRWETREYYRFGIWGGTNPCERGLVAAAVDVFRAAAGELAEECPAGHPWENVARIRPDGSRECRVCWPRGRRTAGGAR